MVFVRSAFFVLLSIGLLFAGCIDEEVGASEDGQGETSGGDAAMTAGPKAAVFSYPDAGEPFNATLQVTGAFEGDPTCVIVICAEPHEHALQSPPAGLLSHLRAELTYSTDGVFPGSVRLSLVMEDGEQYPIQSTFSPGTATLETMFKVNSGAAWLHVISAGNHEQEIDYEMKAWLWADPTVVFPRNPVLLELSPGTNLTIERVDAPVGPSGDAAPVRYLLFDAADSLIDKKEFGEGESTIVVPAEAAAGAFAYIPSRGSPVRLSVDPPATNSLLRPLALEYRYGPGQRAIGPVPVIWTEALDHRPVSVGVYGAFEQLAVSTAVAGHVRIASEAGVVADMPFGCGGGVGVSYCMYMGSGRIGYVADGFSDNIVAGDYEYEVDVGTSTFSEVGALAVEYVR